jgi:alkylation response protein AidB-like acyl-CoA dehydrogenase
VIDQEWVQVNLARVAARVEFLKLMNWKVAWGLTTGAIAPTDA